MADANSGIAPSSFSVRTDFSVAGRPPQSEISDLAIDKGDGIWEILLTTPVPPLVGAHLYVEIADNQGNITRVDRRFSTLANAIFLDGFESGDTTLWTYSAP